MAFARLLAWLRAREVETLAALLLAAAGAWIFVELADEVFEGETASLDEQLLLALRAPNDTSDPLGPPWVEDIARDVTGVGGAGILTLLTHVRAYCWALAERLRRRGRVE